MVHHRGVGRKGEIPELLEAVHGNLSTPELATSISRALLAPKNDNLDTIYAEATR